MAQVQSIGIQPISPQKPQSALPQTSTVKKVLYVAAGVLALAAVAGLAAMAIQDAVHENTSFQDGQALKEKIDALRASSAPDWRTQAIRLIREARKDSPQDELARLRGAGVLTKSVEAKLDFAQKNVTLEPGMLFLGWDKPRHIKKLYAEAVEIKQIYQGTHDVFVHAQSAPWLPITYTVKELWKAKFPEEFLHHFKFLRAPCSTASAGTLEGAYRVWHTVNPLAKKGIERYRDRWFSFFTVSDSDKKVREELLSVDALFFNYARYESALHFLTNNSNILGNNHLIRDVTEKTIAHFYPEIDEKERYRFAKKLLDATQKNDAPCGNLFVICVPKEGSEQVQYRAHPFGRPCRCHPREEDRAILDKLQRGVLDKSTECDTSTIPWPKTPQYRLYLPAIEPGKEEIFLLTPQSSQERHKIKDAVGKTVQSINRIAALKTNIAKDALVLP